MILNLGKKKMDFGLYYVVIKDSFKHSFLIKEGVAGRNINFS